MDYGKSGMANKAKNAPRHTEHNAKGTEKNPFGQRVTKAVGRAVRGRVD